MKLHLDKLVPTRAEVLFCAFLALLVGILSNAKLLLATQDLTSAADSLGSSASQTITAGLAKLDSYAFTTTAVTFAVWALIGLMTLSVIQAFGHVVYEFNEQSRLSSNEFIHPSDFNRKNFWRSVVWTSLGTFMVGVISIAYIIVFCLYILPLGNTYIGAYFSGFRPADLVYLGIGLAVLLTAIVGLDMIARLIRFRHQLVER